MTDDELLKALGRAAREGDRASDPRWSARAQGTLAPGDRDVLEALAQRSAEDHEAWEASRPLDSEARSRIAGRILAGLQADGGERGADGAGAAGAGAEATGRPLRAQSTSAAREGRLIPLPAKRGRAPWLVAAAALAAAAAALLFMRLSPEGDSDHPRGLLGDPGVVALLPVPAYTVAVAGGELEQRAANGGAPATARLGPGSRVEIALRPATRVEGPVAVRGFLIQGGTARPWDVRADVSEQGSARIEGDTETLFQGVPEGEWEIALAIGRPEALPKDPADVLRALQQEDPRTSALRLLRLKVLLLPRAAPPPKTP
ncbi:uncharacterized protein SOCE26_030720 [Sorangium cellulosum]|uniref:Uncharacterized protein n=1 Tax=Sorangium cellulosum TaxID=56 RepID=A0A2L0EQV6_SORCE|nr:hypothetical protein [Sorangium cellulosum]AUX41650.1 uncharacterized protein SOCE26_030720 [Sorangium cellulosum]